MDRPDRDETDRAQAQPATRSPAEWRARLTAEQYRITRRQGTERPYSGGYLNCSTPGTYCCVCCGAALFRSESKFDSGTGWPSFRTPLPHAPLGTREERRLLTRRTEVHCLRCAAHLGHVFADGPLPEGVRYCINSAALSLDADRPENSVDGWRERPREGMADSEKTKGVPEAGTPF